MFLVFRFVCFFPLEIYDFDRPNENAKENLKFSYLLYQPLLNSCLKTIAHFQLMTLSLAQIKTFTQLIKNNETCSLFSWKEFCLVWRDMPAQGGPGPHQHC